MFRFIDKAIDKMTGQDFDYWLIVKEGMFIDWVKTRFEDDVSMDLFSVRYKIHDLSRLAVLHWGESEGIRRGRRVWSIHAGELFGKGVDAKTVPSILDTILGADFGRSATNAQKKLDRPLKINWKYALVVVGVVVLVVYLWQSGVLPNLLNGIIPDLGAK